MSDLAELSRPKYDYHTGIAKNLVRQRSDTAVGFGLILLSFFLQTSSLLWPMRIDDFNVNEAGVIIAFGGTITLFY